MLTGAGDGQIVARTTFPNFFNFLLAVGAYVFIFGPSRKSLTKLNPTKRM